MGEIVTVHGQSVGKAARHLRWFTRAFEEQLGQTARETGNAYDVDLQRLTDVFAAWRKAFDAQKPSRAEDKQAYVGFAAGLMLRTLLRKQPVRVVSRPDGADDANPAYFWPEGYLYVAFCLNVRGLVIEKDFHGQQHLHRDLKDSRTWWSFRENVEEDASLAIAFLEFFAGDEPDWRMPDLFRTGRVHEIAGRFYTHEHVGTSGGP